jgi:hypothetical protein
MDMFSWVGGNGYRIFVEKFENEEHLEDKMSDGKLKAR